MEQIQKNLKLFYYFVKHMNLIFQQTFRTRIRN